MENRICIHPFDLIFDTGNVKSDLGNKFAETFPDAIEGLAEQTTSRGGFGGISQTKAVVLPEFRFEVAGSTVKLYNTEVVKERISYYHSNGWLLTIRTCLYVEKNSNSRNNEIKGQTSK